MTIYNKPAVLPAWAEDKVGVPADMLQPVDADIKVGWPLSAIPPSRQRFNWLLNYAMNAVRYFMQRGLPAYDAAEDYPLHARVQDASGNEYRCIQAGTGHTPATSPTWWRLISDKVTRTGVAAGTVDVITVDFAPDLGALADGDQILIQHSGANTVAFTINADAGGALAVYKGSNSPVIAGDIPGADFWGRYVYDASLAKWQMLNPATGITATVTNSSPIQPITATVAVNALTLGHAGNVPISYRDASLTSGAVTTVNGGALSLVVPSGATLGSIAATPFRVWIAKVLDAGVEYLAVMNTQIVSGINVDIAPVNESGVISTVLIDAASDSAGVWYSAAAHANCPFKLVGYVDLTEEVAGTYATAPSVIQGMSAGVKKPGDVVQRVVLQNNTWSASGGLAVPANDAVFLVTSGSVLHTKSFTPTSGVNLIKGNVSGTFGVTNSGTVDTVGVFDGSTCKRSGTFKVNDSNDYQCMAIDFCYKALTAVARTIQSRFSNDGTAAYVNGIAAGRLGGGAQAAVMVIEEIQA